MKVTGGTSYTAVLNVPLSTSSLTVLCPLVLATDLLFFLGSEIIGDVESLSDLLWRLALDHVGNSLASNIKKGLDVEVVRGLHGQSVWYRRISYYWPPTRMISKSIS